MQASCRLLDVSEAGYYEWRNRPPSLRTLRHTWLLEQIMAVHAASRGTYGARRIHGRTHPWARPVRRTQPHRGGEGLLHG